MAGTLCCTLNMHMSQAGTMQPRWPSSNNIPRSMRTVQNKSGAVPSSTFCSGCVAFLVSLQLHNLVLQLVHRVAAVLACFQQGPRSLQGIPGGPLPLADCC